MQNVRITKVYDTELHKNGRGICMEKRDGDASGL